MLGERIFFDEGIGNILLVYGRESNRVVRKFKNYIVFVRRIGKRLYLFFF